MQISSVKSKELWNIVLLSFGFFFSMGTLLACMLSETILLHGVQDSHFQGTPTMGYICLALNFASLAVSYALSPPLAAIFGSKLLIVVGAALLTLSLSAYFRPLEITLYLSAMTQGLGSGILWTVYSYFLTVNSTKETIGRNTGIFWVIFHCG
ncbi:UNC93-like protein MFSD11 [Paramacrobiotus metropolitanus]|uniref:UNC93-like protein MFSD11 n=1 Tax=Paramacrobiotus metropolitanus TaxID=2943436 RepID=UPI0024457275|nr:UNC93-like protein MFSD11 [Paramacrobiotus metropolitanus]